MGQRTAWVKYSPVPTVSCLLFLPQGPPGPRGRPGPPVGSCMLSILDSQGRRQVPLRETRVAFVCFSVLICFYFIPMNVGFLACKGTASMPSVFGSQKRGFDPLELEL